jgi:hypothetical protein
MQNTVTAPSAPSKQPVNKEEYLQNFVAEMHTLKSVQDALVQELIATSVRMTDAAEKAQYMLGPSHCNQIASVMDVCRLNLEPLEESNHEYKDIEDDIASTPARMEML